MNKNPSMHKTTSVTVARLIEMMQKMPPDALIVVEEAPNERRYCREEERNFRVLSDLEATRASVTYDIDSQAVSDARFSAGAENIQEAVCLRLK